MNVIAALQPVMMAQKENSQLRNQMTQQAIDRRDQFLTRSQQIMASGFQAMNHALTARGGQVDFSI